jgi:hypothetical protein
MAVYKNISCKYVIAKIYRDLLLEDQNYDNDIIEWIGEALYFIGSASQFVQKNQELEIADFKAILPPLVSLRQVKYYNEEEDQWLLIEFNNSTFDPHEDDSPNLFIKTEESYTLNPNYIQTTFETGKVLLSFTSFPVDEEGFPLVPDNQYFREALFWYCFRQIILRGYIPRVQEITYEFADNKWKFYCTAARNQANYPDISEYERFRQLWVGLIPKGDLVDRGFDDRGSKIMTIDKVTAGTLVSRPLTVEIDDGPSVNDGDLGVEEL